MTTYLYRGNDKNEILDASGQVVGRVVPVEPTEAMLHNASTVIQPYGAKLVYKRMLFVATIDLSAVAVKVPERLGMYYEGECAEVYIQDGWNACLDALGVKP